MYDDRDLTPEEAERAYDEAKPVAMTRADLDRLTRKTFILCGLIPIHELTQAEVDWSLRMRQIFHRPDVDD